VPQNPDEAGRCLLGATIRAARVARGYTQQALAKRANVSRGNLALLEKGGNVSVSYLLKVADVLELGPLQFTGTNPSALRVFELLQSLDLIVAVADHLRDFVMTAILPPSEREGLKDSIALKEFVDRHLGHDEGAERLAKAIVHLSEDEARGAKTPRVGEPEPTQTPSARKRRAG
jgi:transcriptional regulator with XRE-family HTH domain